MSKQYDAALANEQEMWADATPKPFKPASPKQLKWLRDLVNAKDYSLFPADWRNWLDYVKRAFELCEGDGFEPEMLNVWLVSDDRDQITMDTFKQILPRLQEAPKLVPAKHIGILGVSDEAASPIATTDGMYKHGDVFYKLRFAKTGKLWAHRLVFLLSPEDLKAKQESDMAEGIEDKTSYAKFKFAGSPQHVGVRENMKLTHEDAKAFGALYGMCCNCGRLLTNEVSIYLGIGPVCGGRQFGGEFKFLVKEAELAVTPK